MNETITIPIERFIELLKKEIGYDYRRSELMQHSWVSDADKVLFNIPAAKVDK